MKRQAFSLRVRELDYALQAWGHADGLPVLALHGWLDNSESFAPLAAHLPDAHLVAPDLAGHGETAHRPVQGSYHLWDDLPDLLALADVLGWQRFAVIGHSRGAMLALLLAAAAPERVERVAFLDGLWPPPTPAETVAEQLRHYLRDANRQARAATVYPDLETAIAVRNPGGLPTDMLAALVQRNLRAVEGGFVWRTDARLRHASALKLTEAHCHALVEALACPRLLLMAERGMAAAVELRQTLARYADLPMQVLPGGHHLHLENPATVAAVLNPFLAAGRFRN